MTTNANDQQAMLLFVGVMILIAALPAAAGSLPLRLLERHAGRQRMCSKPPGCSATWASSWAAPWVAK